MSPTAAASQPVPSVPATIASIARPSTVGSARDPAVPTSAVAPITGSQRPLCRVIVTNAFMCALL